MESNNSFLVVLVKMRTFLFIFLAGCAVRCDDSSYYVIQRLEDPIQPIYNVYWNVPTMQCKSKKIAFENLFEKFGIIQNDEDSFRGEKVAILYDPGLFPALLKNESSGQFKYRNGGVPQEGDLMKHLEVFKNEIEQSIPDKDFNGVGIIDFESWRPIFRQNFGVLTPYKDVSYEIEKQNHWWWKKAWIQAEAKRRFEQSARAFMQTTLATAKKMRPKAKWGYYGFPYCFNMANNNMKETCAEKVNEENDSTYWLWSESTALYPSIYSSEEMSPSQLSSLIKGRVKEAGRVASKDTHILPYFWFRYRNGGFFTKKDLNTALHTLYKLNTTGFIIWGSSKDVNTVDKCNKLLTYVEETLGPAIAKYTKKGVFEDDYEETATETEHTTVYDPDYVWKPPENYTENIHEMVNEELEADKNKTLINDESSLINLILRRIVNYCADGNCEHTRETTEGFILKSSKTPTVTVTEDPFKLNKTESYVTEPTTTVKYEEDSIEDYIEEILLIEEYSIDNTTEISDYDVKDNMTYSTNLETTTEGNYSTNGTDTKYLDEYIVYTTEPNLVFLNEEVRTTDILNDTYPYTTDTITYLDIDNTDSYSDEGYSSTTDIMDTNYTLYPSTNDTIAIANNESSTSNEAIVIKYDEVNNTSDEMVNTNDDIVHTNNITITSDDKIVYKYNEINNTSDEIVNLIAEVVDTNDEIVNTNNETVTSNDETVNESGEKIVTSEEMVHSDAEIVNIDDKVMDSNDTNIFNTTTLAPILTNQVIVSVM